MTTDNRLDLLLANCPTDAECDAAIAQLALHAQLHAEGWSLEALDDAADRCDTLADWRPFLLAFWRGARNGDALRAERRCDVRTTAAGRYEHARCDIDPYTISSWTETSRCGDEADECLAGAALSRAAVRTFDTHCAACPANCATAPAPRPTPPVSPDPAPAPTKKTRPAAPASAAARLEAAREALRHAEAKAPAARAVEVVFTEIDGSRALVPSASGAGVYEVSLIEGRAYACGCEAGLWGRACWHLAAAEAAYRICDAQVETAMRAHVARPARARKGRASEAVAAA